MNCVKFIKILLLSMLIILIYGSFVNATIIQRSDLLSLNDIPNDKWVFFKNKKFYFGHQSVGYNIVSGLHSVIQKHKLSGLNILESHSPSDFNMAFLLHSPIGRNNEPQLKIDDFVAFLKNGLGNACDGAFMKLCYVDVNSDTDLEQLFTYYKAAVSNIEEIFPGLRIVHFTIPLTVVTTSWKDSIKLMLGMKLSDRLDNLNRNKYNQMIRNEYGETGLVFDLARIESTLPDGSRQSFILNNQRYYSLYSGYSSDGGHLNDDGSQKVASKLLLFLFENFTD